MRFEWAPDKAVINLKKHGVAFEQAATLFGDPLALTVEAPDHSEGELRFLTVGLSEDGVLLLVSHADGDGDGIRIISARKAERHESRQYEG